MKVDMSTVTLQCLPSCQVLLLWDVKKTGRRDFGNREQIVMRMLRSLGRSRVQWVAVTTEILFDRWYVRIA